MRAVLLALGVLLLASACGGGGGNELSAAELRTQADQICKDGEADLAEVGEPDSLEGLGPYLEKAIPIFSEQTDKLDELEPPAELEAEWDRAMELNRKSLDIAEEAQQAAESKDQRKFQDAIERGQKNEAELDRLSRKLGLKVCGDDSS